MQKLTNADPHHWGPIPEVVQWLCNQVPNGFGNVLEIGPGQTPFPRAKVFVDNKSRDALKIGDFPFFQVDLSTDKLPFEDKQFDLVYTRHVLEDMHNPFLLCAEMQRVAKAGYIETPSPIAEFCRGADGGSPHYRGYHHHRWIIWPNGNTLNFVTKFPIIEYIGENTADAAAVKYLQSSPFWWNSFFLWKDGFDVKHYQCPQDFDILTQYPSVIQRAIGEYVPATQTFTQQIKG